MEITLLSLLVSYFVYCYVEIFEKVTYFRPSTSSVVLTLRFVFPFPFFRCVTKVKYPSELFFFFSPVFCVWESSKDIEFPSFNCGILCLKVDIHRPLLS